MKYIMLISVLMIIMGGDIEVVMMAARGWILELMMVDVDLGLNLPATFHISIKEKIWR